jgi:ribosome biogenesis protein SSF1/2
VAHWRTFRAPPYTVTNTLHILISQRVVLLNHDAKTGRIEFRHFAISLAPSGVSKGVKALVGSRAIPSLGETLDVADFLTKSGYGSVSQLA